MSSVIDRETGYVTRTSTRRPLTYYTPGKVVGRGVRYCREKVLFSVDVTLSKCIAVGGVAFLAFLGATNNEDDAARHMANTGGAAQAVLWDGFGVDSLFHNTGAWIEAKWPFDATDTVRLRNPITTGEDAASNGATDSTVAPFSGEPSANTGAEVSASGPTSLPNYIGAVACVPGAAVTLGAGDGPLPIWLAQHPGDAGIAAAADAFARTLPNTDVEPFYDNFFVGEAAVVGAPGPNETVIPWVCTPV